MRVLLIEDDRYLQADLRAGLTEAGFAADATGTIADARHLAGGGSYDAIVLDLTLPDGDGREFLRELRDGGDATPVLILSARAMVEDRVTCLDLGADDYLAKPFAFSELVARMRALIRRATVPGTVVLSAADLTLDPVARVVTRAGSKIDLLPKEFLLLEYLLREKGHVVTRTMIAEHVWDMNYDSFSNVIDVHIARLRRKMDEGHDVKLVRTVRGVGYVLEGPEDKS